MKHKRLKHEFCVPEPELQKEPVISDRVRKLGRAALDENEITQVKTNGYDGLWHILVRATTQEQCLAFESAFRQVFESESRG
jgi:hypothetical protein